jgi:hypothetical protein
MRQFQMRVMEEGRNGSSDAPLTQRRRTGTGASVVGRRGAVLGVGSIGHATRCAACGQCAGRVLGARVPRTAQVQGRAWRLLEHGGCILGARMDA